MRRFIFEASDHDGYAGFLAADRTVPSGSVRREALIVLRGETD